MEWNIDKEKNIRMKTKSKILVVDDNLLSQELLSFMLNEWGFKHEICSNGKLAIEKLKLNSYGLILMDIEMPEMDGYETTRFIRENLMLELPIIAMTALVSEEEIEKCFSYGMTNYISKLVKEVDLYLLIINCLSLQEFERIKIK